MQNAVRSRIKPLQVGRGETVPWSRSGYRGRIMKFAYLMEFRNLITVANDYASWMERHLGLGERARTIWFRWNVRKETKPWKLEGTWGKSDSSECWNNKTEYSLILPENAERKFFVLFFFFLFRDGIAPFWNVNVDSIFSRRGI